MRESKKYIFACVVVALIGLFAMFSQSVRADGMEGCEKQCKSCQNACTEGSNYLKSKANNAAVEAAKKDLADCAELCRTSHNLMQSNSKYHPAVCKICAESCNACAKACEVLKDPKLKKCIEECKACAASCERMAG